MSMKIIMLIGAFFAAVSTFVSFSQTMMVQTSNGNKSYNVSDISSITFGKMSPSGNIEMALIAAGLFNMGSTNGSLDEKPVHTVSIQRQYFMSKYLITQKQYKELIGSNPSVFSGNDNNPVEAVNWFEAVQFCNLLSKKEGLQQCYTSQSGGAIWDCDFTKNGYRLPTEAEWEYACRAGTSTDYYSGSTWKDLDRAGWFARNAMQSTQPVGQKVPNNFGLYDMHGDVWEWCWDWYDSYSAAASADPTGPSSGSERVLRGGSWDDDAPGCRSASRDWSDPNNRFSISNTSVGFRIVRTK